MVDREIQRAVRFAGREPLLLLPLARGAAGGHWGGGDGLPVPSILGLALDSNPLYGSLWMRVSEWNLTRGETLGCRFASERAIRLDPTNPRVHYLAGMLALRDGDYSTFRREAIAAQALGEVPEFPSLPWRGEDRLNAAVEAFRRRSEVYPALKLNDEILVAGLLSGAGQTDRALAALESVRALSGKRAWMIDLAEAEIHDRSNDPKGALEILNRRMVDASLRPEEAFQLAYLRMKIITRDLKSDPELARRSVLDATRLRRSYAEPFFALALFFRGRGENAEAVEWARRGAAAEPEKSTSWSILAEIELSAGDYLTAKNSYRHAMRIDKGSEVAFRFLDVALERKDYESARETLSQLLIRFPGDRRLQGYSNRVTSGYFDASSPRPGAEPRIPPAY